MSQPPRTPSKPVVSLPSPPLPGTPPPHKQRGYAVEDDNTYATDVPQPSSSSLVGVVGGLTELLTGPEHPPAPAAAQSHRDGKIVLDRVYEHVALPRLAIDIIDTPEFQRLRGLKQLGFTSWLYPGATHTRFEHSIGVAHLANTMAKKLARQQPELGITEADVLVVTVAGLCHDIGHGPFSHLFEVIVNKVREEKGLPEFHHESMSVALLRRILARLNLAEYGLDHHDAYFMQLCIKGLKPGEPWPAEETGREPWKRFLVEIVSNKRNGIDVDKLDYFMRDSLCCYGRATVDCHIPRLISACRVLYFEKEYQLCWEEKLAQPLGDIFTLRAKMHKYAYQHRIIRVIDHMVTDILSLADPYLLVKGSKGSLRRISECVEDEEGYIRLGDWIMSAIDASPDERMLPAQQLIARLNSREFYAVAGHGTLAEYLDPISKKEICKSLIAILARRIREQGGSIDGMAGSWTAKNASSAVASSPSAYPKTPLSLLSSVRGQKGGFAEAEFGTPSDSTPAELLSPQHRGLNNTTTASSPASKLSLSASEVTSAGAPPLVRSNTVPSASEATTAPPQPSASSFEFTEEAKQFLKDAEAALIVDFVKIHYGSSDSEGNPDDPINHVTFFNPKRSLTQGFKLPKDRQSPLFSPMRYGEKSIVLIVRSRRFVPCLAAAFEEWKAVNRHRFISTVPVYNFSPSKNAAMKRQRETVWSEEAGGHSQLSDGWTN